MKHIKHLLKVVLFGVCLGILLVIVQRGVLHADTDEFLHWYWIIGALVVLGAALINIVYTGHYFKRMREASKLLEAGEIQAYIDAMEALLKKARGKYLNTLIRLNLSAGYCAAKRYSQAVSLLEPIPESHLRPDARMIRRLNLCVGYFHSGQVTKALTLYDESREIFDRWRDSAYYGWNMAMLDMLAGLARGRYDEVRAMLEAAREKWPFPRYQEDYLRIQDELDDAGK